MKKLIYYPLTTLGFILLILLCFIFFGGKNPSEAQRVGRMGFLTEDANSRDYFIYKMIFPTTAITTSTTAGDATVDFGIAGGWTQDTANKYIYTTDGDYLVGINDTIPDAQLDIDISGAAVVGLDIDGAAAQSANYVDIDDATGDPLFTISAAGNVGIGTTESDKLLSFNITDDQVDGISFRDKDSDNYGAKILYIEEDNILKIVGNENTVEKLGIVLDRITGNVGIGTAAPTVPLEVDGLIRSTSSEWYACKYVIVYSADPGTSGATRVAPSSDTLGGWNLDADGETLEFPFHICSDWDATSDVFIRIEYEVDDATATGNAVFDAIVYIKGEGDYVTKSQNLTFTQDVSGDDQYTLRHNDLTIDYDDATDDLSVGAHISVVLNFDATSSDITDVIFVGGTMRYQTNKLRVEIP